MKLLLTFKTTEKDLYDEVCSHSGKGNYIKDLIRKDLEQKGSKSTKEIQSQNSILDDLF